MLLSSSHWMPLSSSRCSNCHNSSYSLRALTTPFTGRWFCGKEIHCLNPTSMDNFQCCKEDIIGLEIAFREAIREKSNKILSDQGPEGEYEAAMNLFTTTNMTQEHQASLLIHMSLSPTFLSQASISSLSDNQYILFHLINPSIAANLVARRDPKHPQSTSHRYPPSLSLPEPFNPS